MDILQGLSSVWNVQCIFLIIAGVSVGILFGSVPGLTANMAVVLCLPLSYSMEPLPGLTLLVSLYIGGTSGGLISAILLGVPGTPASLATCFDGLPMAKKGQAGKALGIGIVYSFLGGLISFIILAFLAPAISRFALQFGPFEYAAVAIFSLMTVSSLIQGSVEKGLIGCVLGLMLATVGSTPVDATTRFTMGIQGLVNGFSTVPALIGLFAVSEIVKLAEDGGEKQEDFSVTASFKMSFPGFTWKEFKEQTVNLLRSALIGTGIGILPGIGAGVSNLVSYATAKSSSKQPEKFGTGCMDGVVASETANNASIGGALVPLMALGIPGDTVTAVLLGGMTLHGLTAGPLLFVNQPDLVYGIFGSLFTANVAMLVLMFILCKIFVKLLSVPKYYLMPVVMVLCMVGAFGTNHRIFDIGVTIIFGIIGYLLNKSGIPASPLVLGLILEEILERNLRRGYMLSLDGFGSFFSSKICLVFLALGIIVFIYALRKSVISSKALSNGEQR